MSIFVVISDEPRVRSNYIECKQMGAGRAPEVRPRFTQRALESCPPEGRDGFYLSIRHIRHRFDLRFIRQPQGPLTIHAETNQHKLNSADPGKIMFGIASGSNLDNFEHVSLFSLCSQYYLQDL